MSKLSTFKTLTDLNTDPIENFTSSEETQNTRLKDAIAKVNMEESLSSEVEQIEISADVYTELESLVAEKLQEELSESEHQFNTGEESQYLTADTESQTPKLNTSNLNQVASKRIKELQRRQTCVDEIRDQLADTDLAVQALAKKSDQLFDYFVKANIELDNLEQTERKYKALLAESEKLKLENDETRSKLEQKQGEIQSLEITKQKHWDSMTGAQLEISRLSEQLDERASEIQAVQADVIKSNNNHIAMNEKHDLLIVENQRIDQKNADLCAKLAESEQKKSEQEIILERNQQEISKLVAKCEQTQLKTDEAQDSYNKLNEKYVTLQTQHEERSFEFDATQRDSDEKIRLKTARIVKLERSIQVLNKQLAITERLLEDANYEDAISSLKKQKNTMAAKTVGDQSHQLKQQRNACAQ